MASASPLPPYEHHHKKCILKKNEQTIDPMLLEVFSSNAAMEMASPIIIDVL